MGIILLIKDLMETRTSVSLSGAALRPQESQRGFPRWKLAKEEEMENLLSVVGPDGKKHVFETWDFSTLRSVRLAGFKKVFERDPRDENELLEATFTFIPRLLEKPAEKGGTEFKRGDRVENPYRGTVVEVTSQIPSGAHAGVPGVLVRFDWIGTDSYSEVLNPEEALQAEKEECQWIPFEKLELLKS